MADDDVDACIFITTSGHLLVNCSVREIALSVPHLGSLVATLQQFSQGQRLTLLQVDLYTVVCATSSTASLVCCVLNTSSENAPTLRLIASYLLHECIRQHESSLPSIVMQTDMEAQANAESYTLASALQGQAKDCTHEDLEAFQNDCILPFLSKSLPSRISSAFESAENLSTKIMGGVILNCESHEVAYSWTRHGKMLESMVHGLLLFAQFLIDMPGDGNKTLVQAPVSEC
ncbi:hypothetical protein LEN26_018627 [Aphanomyces euteiches]|nr:hypothetical protein LEN26_018627 [Aphanomyces euteiches]KAH9104180.1 hypothetical protein AeMF1_019658 [Aphanomyces euteiches]KAH9193632.1 hypothetical protein AeNC1_004406 [Aphanomyces euteiches]